MEESDAFRQDAALSGVVELEKVELDRPTSRVRVNWYVKVRGERVFGPSSSQFVAQAFALGYETALRREAARKP